MFTYLSTYSVLICVEHQHAVYSLDEHLKRRHRLPIAERRQLLATYQCYSLYPPQQLSLPAPSSAPIAELGPAQDGFLCCQGQTAKVGAALAERLHVSYSSSSSSSSSCSYITTNRKEMQKHTNQQHSVKLSRWSTLSAASYAEHAAQLWRPVKVQTFFQERRYVRYFVVQEQEQELEQVLEQGQSQPQTAEQKEAISYKQRLATLSQECETVARKDSDAIERIAEEASAKDRTGWFKRTQWDKHLQAYPYVYARIWPRGASAKNADWLRNPCLPSPP
jgi:hypothetical protein